MVWSQANMAWRTEGAAGFPAEFRFWHSTAVCCGAASGLGGNLIKQRVARPGGGRSGSYRTVITYRASQRAVFLYGFAKRERDNIDDRELDDLKKLARHYLGYTEAQIVTALEQAELGEVACDDQEEG
jgi:hypothetical protein